jgi:hypothetical protein
MAGRVKLSMPDLQFTQRRRQERPERWRARSSESSSATSVISNSIGAVIKTSPLSIRATELRMIFRLARARADPEFLLVAFLSWYIVCISDDGSKQVSWPYAALNRSAFVWILRAVVKPCRALRQHRVNTRALLFARRTGRIDVLDVVSRARWGPIIAIDAVDKSGPQNSLGPEAALLGFAALVLSFELTRLRETINVLALVLQAAREERFKEVVELRTGPFLTRLAELQCRTVSAVEDSPFWIALEGLPTWICLASGCTR